MKFVLEFDCENAAFEADSNAESARILRQVATALENGRVDGPIFDGNGNRVGTFALNVDTE